MKYALFVFLAALFMIPAVHAQGYGTSIISVNSTNITAYAGSTVELQYTTKLYTGSTWGTTMQYSNATALAASGINAHFSNAYGDPTFTGIFSITISNSTPVGTYSIELSATGDDPSVQPTSVLLNVISSKPVTTPTTTITHVAQPLFIVSSISTAHVNGSVGANVSILRNSIKAEIRPGTYIKVGNVTYTSYNFSLAFYNVYNVTSPPDESDYVPSGAFAFEVNGKITPSIEFVNASGTPYPIITFVKAGYNTTSWTFLGGSVPATNSSEYIGGKYAFADSWSHPNATTMVNNEFIKPVMWVFEAKVASSINTTTSIATSTSIPTTIPAYTTTNNNGALYLAIIIVVIVVIIILVYAAARRARH